METDQLCVVCVFTTVYSQSLRRPASAVSETHNERAPLLSACPEDGDALVQRAWQNNRSPPPPQARGAWPGCSPPHARSLPPPERPRTPWTSRGCGASWWRRRSAAPRPPDPPRWSPSWWSAPSARCRWSVNAPGPAAPWSALSTSAWSLRWGSRTSRRYQKPLSRPDW